MIDAMAPMAASRSRGDLPGPAGLFCKLVRAGRLLVALVTTLVMTAGGRDLSWRQFEDPLFWLVPQHGIRWMDPSCCSGTAANE
jgi:hypothetical protein